MFVTNGQHCLIQLEGSYLLTCCRVKYQSYDINSRKCIHVSLIPKIVLIVAACLQHCLASKGWKIIIADESHTLRTSEKPPDARHTEAAVSAVRRSRRAVFLTGTPSLSRPFDLFRQVDSATISTGLLRWCVTSPTSLMLVWHMNLIDVAVVISSSAALL